MKKIRILLADNVTSSRQIIRKMLVSEGYQVIEASNPIEAKQVMETQYLHLAILDLRLVDDSDESDRSGLRLAKQVARFLPKLIWTSFPSYQDVREALKPDSNNLPPVVDFVIKQDGFAELKHQVTKTLAEYVAINWDLRIHFGSPQTLPQLLQLVEPEMAMSLFPDRLQEFEDLLRKLFYSSTQITIGHLYLNRANRLVLPVYAYDQNGDERQFVVIVGQQDAVLAEEAAFHQFVPEQANQKINRIANSAQTNRYAGLAFAYSGTSLERSLSLRQFLQQHSPEKGIAVIRSLYCDHLSVWHQYGRFQPAPPTLTQFLQSRITTPQHEEGHHAPISAICKQAFLRGMPRIDVQAHQLTIHWPGNPPVILPNPDTLLPEIASSAALDLVWGTAHGCVTVDTIRVSASGNPWLIDFSQAGHAPLLWDYVVLETAVKLSNFPHLSLHEAFLLESLLLTASQLNQQIPTEKLSSSAQNMLQIIQEIRQQAQLQTNCDLKSYQLGLILAAHEQYKRFDITIQHTEQVLTQYTLAVLLTALHINDFLQTEQDNIPVQARQSIWLDQADKLVWVEGKQITLSLQDYTIFAHLYEKMGQLCSRKEIVEQALGEPYDKLDPEQSRLNSAISRLRQKVEPDPKNPKYFLTIRGRGYKLQT